MKKKDQNTETPPREEEDVTHEAAEATLKAAKKRTRKEGSSDAARRPRWKPSLLGYSWVMKNISYFLFLAALAVVYIYNGHYADKISRDITRTNRELKELQYEYKTLKSEVMFRSKQSELAKAVEPFGLKESIKPPYVLVDSLK